MSFSIGDVSASGPFFTCPARTARDVSRTRPGPACPHPLFRRWQKNLAWQAQGFGTGSRHTCERSMQDLGLMKGHLHFSSPHALPQILSRAGKRCTDPVQGGGCGGTHVAHKAHGGQVEVVLRGGLQHLGGVDGARADVRGGRPAGWRPTGTAGTGSRPGPTTPCEPAGSSLYHASHRPDIWVMRA